MTPSNATKATAFAGNARRKHGTKPLKNPKIVSTLFKNQNRNRNNQPPKTSRTTFSPYRPSGISPARKSPPLPQLIRHNPLLHNIGRVGRNPENLRREATGPEIDSRGGECGVL